MLKELITDPSSGELSTSRFGLLLMNIVGACVGIFLAYHSPTQCAVILTGLATTDASVYALSTRKHFGKNCENEGEE